MLKQILSNLLSNAINIRWKEVQLSLQQDDTNKVIFTIIDTGISIDNGTFYLFKDTKSIKRRKWFWNVRNERTYRNSMGLSYKLEKTRNLYYSRTTNETDYRNNYDGQSTPYKNTGPVSHHLIFENHAALGTMGRSITTNGTSNNLMR